MKRFIVILLGFIFLFGCVPIVKKDRGWMLVSEKDAQIHREQVKKEKYKELAEYMNKYMTKFNKVDYSDIFAKSGLNIDSDGNDAVDVTYGGLNTTSISAAAAAIYGVSNALTEATFYNIISDVSNFTQPGVSESITSPWSFSYFRGTQATGALGSIATRDMFWTDGTYDPAGDGGSTPYLALKTASGYKQFIDQTGQLHASFSIVRTEFIPVSYMIDGASAPDALATYTSGTEKVNARTFAGDADEDLLFKWDVPADLDTTSGVKFMVECIITAGVAPSSETWQFEIQGCSLGDGDALDCTLGTAQTSNSGSRSDAQYDLIKTAYSSAMTSTHITDLAVGEEVIFKLYRDVDDTDTYVQNVGVTGIRLKYKVNFNATF